MLKQLLMIIALSFVLFFGCSEPETITLEFRIAEDEPAPGLTEMVFSPTGENFYLHEEIMVDQTNVNSAKVIKQNGQPAIELLLTSEGTNKFEVLTGSNIGKRCGMIMNGQLVSAPTIRDTIKVGRAIITGDFTEDEAETIAKGLTKH